MKDYWEPTRAKPSWWCWLLHRMFWFSNDFGTWWVGPKDHYCVRCTRCHEVWKVGGYDEK